MIVGRMLAWLATALTAVVLVAWLVVGVLLAGGPGLDALRRIAPDSAGLEELAGRLGESAPSVGPRDSAEEAESTDGSLDEGSEEDADSVAEGRSGEGAAQDDESDPAAEDDEGASTGDPSDESADTERSDAVAEPPAGADGNGNDLAIADGSEDDGLGNDVDDSGIAPSVNWPDFEAYEDLALRQPAVQTTHFDLHAADAFDPLLIDAANRWATEIESIHDYVTSRAGPLASEPVAVLFDHAYDARCPARGLASPGGEAAFLVVFIDEETTDTQVRAVLAHEIAHHVFGGPEFVGDGVLTEGLANWAAGDYALAWQGLDSWTDGVREALREGRFVSVADDGGLTPRQGENCVARRDRVYNIRAGFVTWLVETKGLDLVRAMPVKTETRFDAISAERIEMTLPDYEAATGRSLTQLEGLWLQELLGANPQRNAPDAPTGDDPSSSNEPRRDGATNRAPVDPAAEDLVAEDGEPAEEDADGSSRGGAGTGSASPGEDATP